VIHSTQTAALTEPATARVLVSLAMGGLELYSLTRDATSPHPYLQVPHCSELHTILYSSYLHIYVHRAKLCDGDSSRTPSATRPRSGQASTPRNGSMITGMVIWPWSRAIGMCVQCLLRGA
jgi:hypothetical protein